MSNRERIPLTDELLFEIRGHIDRTLVGPHLLLKMARKAVPEGLSRPTLENWLYKRCRTARADYVDFVLKEWKALPDGDVTAPLPRNRKVAPRHGYVEITSKIRAELEAFRLAKLIPSRIFKERNDVPEGLQPSMISAWVNGSACTARSQHLFYVLDVCRKFMVEPADTKK
jgi:hypothetical protein